MPACGPARPCSCSQRYPEPGPPVEGVGILNIFQRRLRRTEDVDTIRKVAVAVVTLVAILASACSTTEPEDRVFDLEINNRKLSMIPS